MKMSLAISLLLFLFLRNVSAQSFEDHFIDKTLRVDYIFSGNASQQRISLDELAQLSQWAGRRHNLSALPVQGNGQIEMKDVDSGKIIYMTSFSTLFQEWLVTDEANNLNRGFENTYLLPFPRNKAEITVTLRDNRGEPTAVFTHVIDPKDVLIRKRGMDNVTPYQYLVKSGDTPNMIDVVILAEGYTEGEKDIFYKDANATCESLFAHEPFGKLKHKFNIIAVESWSEDSGVSVPGKGEWKNTSFSSHFDTFYSTRYLTSSRVKDIHNVLAGIPYEHIIILANTAEYGGGGIYNAFTLTTTHHYSFAPVVVHEFGHSFAGLGDEYYYENDTFSGMYVFNIEPWEQNLTSLVNFKSKWEDMLPKGTPVPTDPGLKKVTDVGVYEGAGYSLKGIYRPAPDCRMKTNSAAAFCPVCQRAIERMIDFYTN